MNNTAIDLYKIFRNSLALEPRKSQINLLETIISSLNSEEKKLIAFAPQGSGKPIMIAVLAEYLLQKGAESILILTNSMARKECIEKFVEKAPSINFSNTYIINVQRLLSKWKSEKFKDENLRDKYDYIITEDIENYDAAVYKEIMDNMASRLISFSSLKYSSNYEGAIPVLKTRELNNYNLSEISRISQQEARSIMRQLEEYKNLVDKELEEKRFYKDQFEKLLLNSEREKEIINESYRRQITELDKELNNYKRELELYKERYNNQKSMAEALNEAIALLNTSMSKQIGELRKDLNTGVERISSEIKVLYEEIKNLSNVLVKLQEETIEKIMQIKSNDEHEEESIYHNFSNELMNKINTLIDNEKNSKYDEVKENLINIFGKRNWEKLSAQSREYLITSRIIYHNMKSYEHQIDFSPVCIPITKSLERELFIYIFDRFKKYCNDKSIDHRDRPSGIVFYDKDKNTYEDLRDKNFSLGKISYFFGKSYKERKVFEKYAKEELFHEKAFYNDAKMSMYLRELETDVNNITVRYRNQAAHKDQIGIKEAEKCYEYIISVTKVLVNFISKLK